MKDKSLREIVNKSFPATGADPMNSAEPQGEQTKTFEEIYEKRQSSLYPVEESLREAWLKAYWEWVWQSESLNLWK